MTKKFLCIQGSPEIPKGSMVEKDGLSYALYIQGVRYNTPKGTPVNLEPWQVEGNECWEEVKEEMIESTAEQTPDKQSIAQECYNQCLVVECGEGECAEAIATRFPKFVNRIEVQEETKEEEKPTRWKPKVGQPFYCLDESGFVGEDEWDGTLGDERMLEIGNCFQTEQEAYDELKRRESIANAWRPKEGEEFYYWSFQGNHAQKAVIPTKFHYASMFIGAVHPTEEACQRWGKTYAKYFLPKTE